MTILIVDNLSVTAQLYQFNHTLGFGAGRRQVFFSAGSYNNHRDGGHFITNKEDFVRKQYVQLYENVAIKEPSWGRGKWSIEFLRFQEEVGEAGPRDGMGKW